MKNQLKRSRVLNGVLAGALALVVVGSTAVVGAVSNGFQDWGRLSAPVQVQTNGAEEVKSGFEVSNVQENGIRLMSATIDETNYEDYGISPLAESAITLTATVLPANATHQVVTWSVRWKDSSDVWASSHTVTDYVTVQSIGDKKATVSCLQAFGAQIEVVATMKEDSSKTATCTVGYIKRISNVASIELEDAQEQGLIYFSWQSADEGVYCTREITNIRPFDEERDGAPVCNYTPGTISAGYVYINQITFVPTQEVVEAITDETGIVLYQEQEYDVLAFGNYLINCIESVGGSEQQLSQEGIPETFEELNDVLYDRLTRLGVSEIGELRFYLGYNAHDTYCHTIPVLFNAEDWEVAVSSVALDSTEITF